MSHFYTIETGVEKVVGHCDCCGQETRVFRGFIYRDHHAFGSYLVAYTVSHPEAGSSMAISMYGWAEGDNREDRECVSLIWRLSDTGPGCMVIDPDAAYFSRSKILGRMLTREQALSSGRAREAFDITDEVWKTDARLANSIDAHQDN